MRVLEVLKYLEAREVLHSTVCVLRLRGTRDYGELKQSILTVPVNSAVQTTEFGDWGQGSFQCAFLYDFPQN